MSKLDDYSEDFSESPSVVLVNGRPVENPVVIDDSPGCLTIEKLIAVSRGGDNGHIARVVVSDESLLRCERSAQKVREAVMRAQAEFDGSPPEKRHLYLIYGVNTGFGMNRDKPVRTFADCCKLSENILHSHCAGVGPALPTEVVRATMLLRLRTFAQGRSGVRPELVELLAEMLNRRVHPWVPAQGSVGASGDLCSLAHLGLVLIGQGSAWVEPEFPSSEWPGWEDATDKRGAPVPGADALRAVGLEPLGPAQAPGGTATPTSRLAPKEGLALTNGSAVATAVAALAIYDAETLLGSANLAGAMTLQAVGGITRAFEPIVQRARGHRGQEECARELMRLAANRQPGGLDNAAAFLFQTQDDYSLRAIPPVHGAVLSAVRHAKEVVEAEMNAATDNPLIFAEAQDDAYRPYDEEVKRPVSLWPAYSAANFHGEPVGLVADYLKLALAELGSISERRIQLLLDARRNRGLPANLSGGRTGLDSGFMLFQYTAASLVSENKVLCHPASADSIPTSADAEDHVSMATTAARHLRQVALNVSSILAAELICATQALLFRTERGVAVSNQTASEPPGARPHTASAPCQAVMRKVSEVSPFVAEDDDFARVPPHERVEAVRRLVLSGTLLRLARQAAGD